MRGLGGGPNGEAVPGRFIKRDHPSRFDGHGRLSGKIKGLFEHEIGGGQGAVDVTCTKAPVKENVVRQIGLKAWGIGGPTLRHV